MLCAMLAACSLLPRENQHVGVAPLARAVLPVAQTALDAGQIETAKRLYQRLLDADPQSYPARVGLGQVAHQQRDAAQAMRWFVAALAHAKTKRQRHDALLYHARAALDAGELEHAQGSFARLTDPQEAASSEHVAYGLNGVGITLLLSGDLRGAVTLLEEAVEQLPGDQNLRGNLSLALEMLAEQVVGRTDAAEPLTAGGGQTPAGTVALPRSGPEAPDAQAAADRIERAVARFEQAAERLANVPDPHEPRPPAEGGAGAPPPAPANVVEPPPPTPPAPADVVEQRPPTPPAPADVVEQRSPAPAAVEEPPPSAPVDVEQPPPVRRAPTASSGFLVIEDEGPFVQMGAYAEASTANALVESLRRLTEQPVRVVEGGGLHRVRIGPLKTQQAMQALAGALRDEGYGDIRMSAPAAQRDKPDAPAPSSAARHVAKERRLTAFVVTAGGEKFLQIGAFGARETAAARADEVRGLLVVDVRVVAGALPNGKPVHRVRVGPLGADADLAAVVEALSAAGYRVAMPPGTKVAPAKGRAPSPPPQKSATVAPRSSGRQATATPASLARPAPPPPARQPAQASPRTADVGSAAPAPPRETIPEPAPRAAAPPASRSAATRPVLALPSLLRSARAHVITQDAGVFIQLGDYHARTEAEELASRLRRLSTEPVRVVEERASNAPFYRVRVGPAETDADYEALRSAVTDLGFDVE